MIDLLVSARLRHNGGRAVSARGRGRVEADRKKCVLVMLGKALDIRRVSLQQSRDHGVARFADIEPNDFWRSPAQHAHSNEVLVPRGQNEWAVACEIPEQSIRGAGVREISDVFRTGE